MSVTSGRQLGPYVLGERWRSSGSGEWFVASDVALERPVSILVTPLSDAEGAAQAVRELARRIAAVTDPRLLPVYGQGEDNDVLWLATGRLAGGALAEIGDAGPGACGEARSADRSTARRNGGGGDCS